MKLIVAAFGGSMAGLIALVCHEGRRRRAGRMAVAAHVAEAKAERAHEGKVRA